jgi:acetolactate synthase-1/2/3 large subunit
MAKAFYIARSGRPGPVLLISLKCAVWWNEFSNKKCTNIRSYNPKPTLNIDKLRKQRIN